MTLRWLATMGAAVLALAICIAAVWLLAPWDLATRVAVGTSAGVVVGAVIAVWGGANSEASANRKNISTSSRDSDPLRGPSTKPQSLESREISGSLVVQSGGDVDFGHAVITVNAQTPPEPGIVTATVTAFHRAPPDGGWSMTSPMRHEGSLHGGRLTIRPAHAYLDLVRSGAILEPLPYQERKWVREVITAQLDIKVVNNTADTLTVHQVRLDVARSVDYIQNIPVVQFGKVELAPKNKVYIQRPIDFAPGWPDDVTVRFHLEHPRRPVPLTMEHIWPYNSAFSINDDHPLMLALAEAGAFAREPEASKQGGAHELNAGYGWYGPPTRTWNYGPFKDGQTALIAGTLDYSEPDIDGTQKHRSYDFRAPMDLMKWELPPPAMMMPWSEAYTASIFKRSGTDYFIEVPVSHSLVPREADRLLVALPVETASTHEFDITLLCNTGSVKCGSARLEAFKPRSGR